MKTSIRFTFIILYFITHIYLVASPSSVIYSGGETPDYFEINDNYASLYMFIRGKEYIEKGYLLYYLENNIPFITIGNKSKYLFLHNKDLLLLQNIQTDDCLLLSSKMSKEIETIEKPIIATSNSYLVEDDILYNPEKLKKNNFSGIPFATDRKIGWQSTTIYLEWSTNSKNILILGNGFVDYKRTYLYTQNSRLKKICIQLDNDEKKYIFKLADSPDPQILVFPKKFKKATIKIYSVYDGLKWKDVCINFIWAGLYFKNLESAIYPE